MDSRRFVPIAIAAGVALLLLYILSSSLFITIQPGHRAVMFKKFGGGLDKETVYSPGFHVKAPWNEMYVYDVREKKAEETMNVLDKSGLSINVDVSVRFRPEFNKIGYLHENFGLNYENTLVVPEVRSTVRKVMGRYTAEEIYSTKRSEVEDAIKSETEDVLGSDDNNIQMQALLIRAINLPDQIKQAIENKLQQEQEALAYQFILDKERSEAERRRVAAEGEAQANRIVNQSLTEMLLRMRGIEATSDLAQSPNSKVVVVGSGKDGLPLILGSN